MSIAAHSPFTSRPAVIHFARAFLGVAVVLFWSTSAFSENLRIAVSTPALAKGHPFDPYTGGSVVSALYDGLTQISLTGEAAPALALSWSAASDTEWVFKLRPRVLFHNGKPVTAKSVADVLNFVASPDASRFWVAQQLSTIKFASVIDESTISITTHQPDPLLPRRMSIIRIADLDEWKRSGETTYKDAPIGTGPYRLISWGPNATDIHLVAFDQSWRKGKDITSIEMKVIPDQTRSIQSLLSGELDLAVNLDPDSISGIEGGGLKVLTVPNPIVISIALRTIDANGSPLLDVRVRRALNHAVNKTVIADQVLQGLMQVASQGATPNTVGYDPKIAPYSYDPDKSRKMLAEAGYPDGFSMTIRVWIGQVPGDALIFQQVAQDLGRVGVRAELQVLSFPEFSRRLQAGDWQGIDAFSINWSSRIMNDALPALELHSCRRVPTPFFCDAEVDQAVDIARYEMDPLARNNKLQHAMAVAAAPSIFLINYADIVAMRRDINGYEVRSDGILFEKMTIGHVPSPNN